MIDVAAALLAAAVVALVVHVAPSSGPALAIGCVAVALVREPSVRHRAARIARTLDVLGLALVASGVTAIAVFALGQP